MWKDKKKIKWRKKQRLLSLHCRNKFSSKNTYRYVYTYLGGKKTKKALIKLKQNYNNKINNKLTII